MPRLSQTKPDGAPTYADMITQALVFEAETEHGRKGSTLPFIKKYLEEHYSLDVKADRVKGQIKRAIERGIELGNWIHPGDNIARIKLTPEAKKDEVKINKAKVQSGLEDLEHSESEESELSSSPAPKAKKAPAKKTTKKTPAVKKTTSSTTKKASPVKSPSKAKATTSTSKATKKKK